MPGFVFKLNHAGVRKLLRSEGMRAHLEQRAQRIAKAADEAAGADGGHEVRTEIGPNRARAVVVTTSSEAIHGEATQRTLTRSIDAGRG